MPGAKKPVAKRARVASGTTKSKRTTATDRPASPTLAAAVDDAWRPARRVRMPKHQLRMRGRVKYPFVLPSAWKITKDARQLMSRHWKTIGGIVLIYGVLNMVLVRGLSGGANVSQLKSAFDALFHGVFGHLASGVTIFVLLLTSTTSTSGANGAATYQTLLILIVSLALVWAYRQLLAGKRIRLRDAYYRGMYPLVPVTLVLLLVAIELIPLSAGGWLFGTVIQNGIASNGFEKFVWGLVFLALAAISIYMLCSSLFALYVATLPDMTPMKALRSARELVRHRRWPIIRKLLFLPFWILVVSSLIMLPCILIIPAAAQWLFIVLTMVAIAFIHAYLYTLYRELLNEEIPS